jgi:hypothetical protein
VILLIVSPPPMDFKRSEEEEVVMNVPPLITTGTLVELLSVGGISVEFLFFWKFVFYLEWMNQVRFISLICQR